jgi:hypothetical protein
MAVMIPSTPDNIPFTTAGERKLFDLFRKTLPDRCIVRYEILLGEQDRRPDYTLIDPKRGVLIVEVKDWGIDSITRATSEQFWVRGYGGRRVPKPNMNPDLKCQIYLRDAREQCSAPRKLDTRYNQQTEVEKGVSRCKSAASSHLSSKPR